MNPAGTITTDDLDGLRLATLVAGIITGTIDHLGGILEVELLHDGTRFVNALHVTNPRTRSLVVVTVTVAP